MAYNPKDLAAGLVFVATGLLYGTYAVSTLTIGTALNMGAGYFPVALSILLALLGVAVVAKTFLSGPGEPIGAPPWRALLFVIVAILFFAATFETIGLFPAVFVAAYVASLAYSPVRPFSSLVASAVIAWMCAVVFGYFLKLPVPIFGLN